MTARYDRYVPAGTYGWIIAGTAIFAIGRTPEEAYRAYVHDTGDDSASLDMLLDRHPASGYIYALPCTERLYQAVDQFGGDLNWDDYATNGVADLDPERPGNLPASAFQSTASR